MTLLDIAEVDLSPLCPLARMVAKHFLANPHRWIHMHELAAIGGTGGWSTRVRECRRIGGLRIENRQRTVNGYRQSEYRYLPGSGV